MKRHEDEPDPPPPFQALEIDPTKMEDESPSRLEWLRQKTELGEENEPLDRLMCMVGLEDVKAHFLLVKARVEAAKRRDAMGELRLDLVLMGSLGTGMMLYLGSWFAVDELGLDRLMFTVTVLLPLISFSLLFSSFLASLPVLQD